MAQQKIAGGYAGDMTPKEAWQCLREDPQSHLIDVRSSAEWVFVGLPNLQALGREVVCVAWQEFPTMQVESQFAEKLTQAGCAPENVLLFLCRSGQRSRDAAICATQAGFQKSYNIAGGFEGDKDSTGHRGTCNGWKYDALPWMQG